MASQPKAQGARPVEDRSRCTSRENVRELAICDMIGFVGIPCVLLLLPVCDILEYLLGPYFPTITLDEDEVEVEIVWNSKPEVNWSKVGLTLYLLLLFAVVNFIVIFGLYVSTDPETPVAEALEKTRRYGITQTVWFTLHLGSLVVRKREMREDVHLGEVFLLLFKLACILVAGQFMKDLEQLQQDQDQWAQPEVAPVDNNGSSTRGEDRGVGSGLETNPEL